MCLIFSRHISMKNKKLKDLKIITFKTLKKHRDVILSLYFNAF